MKTRPLLSFLLLAGASLGACSLGDPENPPDALGASEQAATTSTVTISGRVFYNDRRSHGLFSARRTPDGSIGKKCGKDGVFSDGTACDENWLGAHFAVVDVVERDVGYYPPNAPGCKPEDVLASVIVAADGSFSATVPVNDPCTADAETRPSIAVKVRLRFCGAWCFSLDSAEGQPYALYHPDASPVNPLHPKAGQAVRLADMYFNQEGADPSVPNDTAIAANYYASLVDTVLTVHRDNGIPFYKDEYGEVQYIFPSSISATATTLSASEVVISTFEHGWPSGTTPAHEYGHVLMLRAWDGDYGFDGVGISAGDSKKAVSRQIAFKEAWAELIAHAVFPATNGCARASFDLNQNTPLPGDLGEGAQWRLNVTKALCDWLDDTNDDDPTLAGAGDHFTASLYSMWFNVRNMYLHADDYGGDYAGEGLWFCDYVDYYTDVRKSAAAVGSASHESYESWITDLIYNNNIACFRPAP